MLLPYSSTTSTFHALGPSTGRASQPASTNCHQSLLAITTPSAGPCVAVIGANVLTAMFDQLEHGVMVCGPESQLLFANSQAQAELRSGRLLRQQGDLLRHTASDGAGDKRLQQALRTAILHGKRRLITLQSKNDRLMVSVMPLAADSGSPALALVLIGRRQLCSEVGLQLLAAEHGLTHAERRVLLGFLAERSADEIARDAGITIATVRTQIGSVRSKLNAKSINQLLVRLAEVPPMKGSLQSTSWPAADSGQMPT